MGRDMGSPSIGGIKKGPGKGQPQWQQWERHEDLGGERNSSTKGTAKAKAGGHFEGEMIQMWRDQPLCIPVSFEAKR